MAHKKPSVRKEAEIDYQAKKNIADKHSRLWKESRKKIDKLREELTATIPSRDHKWPKWRGLKDTEESKRIKKELTKVHKLRKYVDKSDERLEELGDKPITKHGTGSREKKRLLSMGVYRDKKGGQVLEAPSGSLTQTERAAIRKKYSNKYKKKLSYN